MVSLQNEFSYVSSDFQPQYKNKNILYMHMVSFQNEFSYVSSDFQLENMNKNILYKQMVSLQNEFSCESSLMEDTPKHVTVIKAKFNKIVPKCSRFPLWGFSAL